MFITVSNKLKSWNLLKVQFKLGDHVIRFESGIDRIEVRFLSIIIHTTAVVRYSLLAEIKESTTILSETG
jgi:hypothetical protein